MRPLVLPSGRIINLDLVTHAAPVTWRQSQPDGSIPTFSGSDVHFVGGSKLRMTGVDATALKDVLTNLTAQQEDK